MGQFGHQKRVTDFSFLKYGNGFIDCSFSQEMHAEKFRIKSHVLERKEMCL